MVDYTATFKDELNAEIDVINLARALAGISGGCRITLVEDSGHFDGLSQRLYNMETLAIITGCKPCFAEYDVQTKEPIPEENLRIFQDLGVQIVEKEQKTEAYEG